MATNLVPVGQPYSVHNGTEYTDMGGIRSTRLPRFPALEELESSYVRRILLENMAENSPTTSSFIWTIRQMAAQSKWKIVSKDEKDPRKEFLETVFFKDLNQGWDDLLSSMLTKLVHGWVPLEIVHKVRVGPKETDPRYKSLYTDRKIGLRMLGYRPQLSIYDWQFHDDGRLKRLWQQFDGRNIPLEAKNLLFCRTTGIRPDGQSILRGAYSAYFRGQVLEHLEAIGIERNLAGFPVLQLIKDKNKGINPPDLWNDVPENQHNIKLRKFLEKMIIEVRRDRNEGALLPEWVELKLISGTGGGRSLNMKDSLERYDLRLLQALLADFLQLGTATGAGSYGLGETRQSLFLLAEDGFLERFAGMVNIQVIPELLYLNAFETDDPPQLVNLPLHPRDLAALGSFFQTMKQAGLAVKSTEALEQFLTDTTGLPIEILDQVTPKDELEVQKKAKEPGPTSDGPRPPKKEGSKQER